MIRADITLTMDITLIKRAAKSDSDSDSEIEKKKKKDIKSERNVVVFINTLQSLITSATNYIMNWIALLKVE